MSDNLRTELVLNAFKMALGRTSRTKKTLAHADRGVQYTAEEFSELLQKSNFELSHSRKGNCWDNPCRH